MRNRCCEAMNMQISQAITDFAGVVEKLRSELTEVRGQLQELEIRRRTIENALPHADEIASVFLRGLDGLTKDFEQQFASHLKVNFVDDRSSVSPAFLKRSSDLLRIEANKPDLGTVISRSQSRAEPDINGAVLAYFLREKIAAELPSLIKRLCPPASSGLKADDRMAAMSAIDMEITLLKEKEAELLANLETARKCF
jgi:hypothetical protein